MTLRNQKSTRTLLFSKNKIKLGLSC